MADRMSHRAKVGDLAISTAFGFRSKRYALVRVASIRGDGWIESVRELNGTGQRLRGDYESFLLVALRPETVAAAALVVRRAQSLEELKTHLRPFRDATVYDGEDHRTDGRRVNVEA